MKLQGAAAVIFDEDGRVLLVKENYDRRRYGLPGGALEPGESPEDTVVRETREETGVEVAIEHLVGTYSRADGGFTGYVFRCRIANGTPRLPGGDEIAEVGWFDPAQLPAPVTNLLHDALPDALAGRRSVVRHGLPRLN